MPTSVKVIADSLAPCGARLTTILARYPRPIHAEPLTHREMSRNSASSRAIPTDRLIARVEADPWIPSYIGANQRGMQAGDELPEWKRERAVEIWEQALRNAIASARQLQELGVSKQVVNRLIEPGMYIEVIYSSTSWTNWDALRIHPAAEPHFQEMARLAKEARDASTPKVLKAGEWHLPFFGVENAGHEDDWGALDDWIASTHAPGTSYSRRRLAAKVSVGRCARVSYLTHDGKRDISEDIKLYDKMAVQEPLHASPAEHVAQALDWPAWFRRMYPRPETTAREMQNAVLAAQGADGEELEPTLGLMHMQSALAWLRSGNFLGFRQVRKTLKNEYVGGLMP